MLEEDLASVPGAVLCLQAKAILWQASPRGMTELCKDTEAEQGRWGPSVVKMGLPAFLETAP